MIRCRPGRSGVHWRLEHDSSLSILHLWLNRTHLETYCVPIALSLTGSQNQAHLSSFYCLLHATENKSPSVARARKTCACACLRRQCLRTSTCMHTRWMQELGCTWGRACMTQCNGHHHTHPIWALSGGGLCHMLHHTVVCPVRRSRLCCSSLATMLGGRASNPYLPVAVRPSMVASQGSPWHLTLESTGLTWQHSQRQYTQENEVTCTVPVSIRPWQFDSQFIVQWCRKQH